MPSLAEWHWGLGCTPRLLDGLWGSIGPRTNPRLVQSAHGWLDSRTEPAGTTVSATEFDPGVGSSLVGSARLAGDERWRTWLLIVHRCSIALHYCVLVHNKSRKEELQL